MNQRTGKRVSSVSDEFYSTWKERSQLREVEDHRYEVRWEGLLTAQPNQRVYLYGMPFADLSIVVAKVDGGYAATACINTIDDGPGVFRGPVETSRKARSRADLMVRCVERWGGWNPTWEQVDTFCHSTGTVFEIF